MVKIAFFEVPDNEIEVLKKSLKGYVLKFFHETLTLNNIGQVKDFDIISVFIYSKIDEQLLNNFSNLKYITTRSMGFDHIDLDTCKKKGIKISNVPHYGENSVAEHAFGLILSLSRNIHKAYVRNLNENHTINGLEGFDLQGKTIGVLGVGHIGAKVIQIAKGFEMNVLANDCYPDKQLAKKVGFTYTSLNNLFKKSDVITLHVPYCKENHHLINKKSISLMKKNVLIINTARGPLIDTNALMNALNKNEIGGVGLDVIEGEDVIKEEKELLHEPKNLNIKKIQELALDHRIIKNEKVVFTPHIAFYSKEAVQKILDVTIQNINSFAKGKIVNSVN